VRKTPQEYYRVTDTIDMTPQGLIAQVIPVSLVGSPPVKITGREARVIDGDKSYNGLLEDLGIAEAAAPKYDWSQTRLIAAFAGEKEEKGHAIRIEKAIHRKQALEIYIREAYVEPAAKDKAGPDWPYDVVKIDNPKKGG